MNKNLSESQVLMVKNAIATHVSALYREADAYSRNGNIEATKDCFNEARKYNELKKIFDQF